MEAVAKKAGVGKPTVYRWWPDRTDLPLVYSIAKSSATENTGIRWSRRELKVRMQDLFSAWRETPAGRVFRSLVVEMQASPETVPRFRDEALEPDRKQSALAFERAKERGAIPDNADVNALVDLLYGWAWYRLLTGQLVTDDDFESALDTIALGARAPRPQKTERASALKST